MENKYPTEERWYDLYELAIHHTFKAYTKDVDLLAIYEGHERLKEFFEDCQKYETKFPLKKATVMFRNNSLEVDIFIEDHWTIDIYYIGPGGDPHQLHKVGIGNALSASSWSDSAKEKLDSQFRLKKIYMLDILGEEAKELKDAPYTIVKNLYDTFTKVEEE